MCYSVWILYPICPKPTGALLKIWMFKNGPLIDSSTFTNGSIFCHTSRILQSVFSKCYQNTDVNTAFCRGGLFLAADYYTVATLLSVGLTQNKLQCPASLSFYPCETAWLINVFIIVFGQQWDRGISYIWELASWTIGGRSLLLFIYLFILSFMGMLTMRKYIEYHENNNLITNILFSESK